MLPLQDNLPHNEPVSRKLNLSHFYSYSVLLQPTQLFLLHLPDAVVEKPAVVVRDDLPEGAAAGARGDIATGADIAPSDQQDINVINVE